MLESILLIFLFVSPFSAGNISKTGRAKRDMVVVDESVTTTAATTTFHERLDAPLEHIEIRLIDDHANSTDSVHPEPPPATNEVTIVKNVESGAVVVTVSEENERNSESSTREHEYEDKYRKVEYVSDVIVATEQPNLIPEVTTEMPEPDRTYMSQGERNYHYTTRQSPAVVQPNAWLALSNSMPQGEELEIELPPELDEDESVDDEPEPVEECMTNKNQLGREVVGRLQNQIDILDREVRKLNRLQKQFCRVTGPNVEHRKCPSWREEKFVHYYKLMRLTYCQDKDKWPISNRVKRQYDPYVPLFETLYAFQKSESGI